LTLKTEAVRSFKHTLHHLGLLRFRTLSTI
jgi:hypothetical protein